MLVIALQGKDHAVRFGARRAARYLAWGVANRLAGFGFAPACKTLRETEC